MLAKLGNIDFGKWSLTTSSGFPVTLAIIFVIDALTPGHLTQSIFTDNSAGEIIVFGLIAVVISSVFGLLIDSIFHTFGRWYAKKFWAPLDYALKFRNYLMLEIGLTEIDFDWIFTSNKEKNTDAVEKDYMRFTEVAGSVAYTMMLLLGPGVVMLLNLEYHQTWLLSFFLGLLVVIGGYILLLTSAASIYKYEMRTTSYTMDDIRKLCPSLDISNVTNKIEKGIRLKHDEKPVSRKKWQPKKLARSLFILALSIFMILVVSPLARAPGLGDVNKMQELKVIGQSKSDSANSSSVPTIEITVNKDVATPADKSAAMVVTLKKVESAMATINAEEADNLVKLADMPNGMKPKWQLSVKIYNPSKILEGEDIYIYALLSFKDDSGERITSGNVTEGEWLFPVLVKIGETKSLLAQIRVKITSSSASGTQSSNKVTADKPAEIKTTAEKLNAEKFSANIVTADKFAAEKFVGEKVSANKITAENISMDKATS
jgi:hypothetical protein